MSEGIRTGDHVEVQTASGQWIPARVVDRPPDISGGGFLKFYVVFQDDVRVWPWPVESVRKHQGIA